jgi:RimJ/RimL family protein N-acetyltransferase
VQKIKRLAPEHALEYRSLMLEAYARYPDAFTSSVQEREALPLDWWRQRLSTSAQANDWVFGAFEGGQLVGVAGLSFHTREKLWHKCTLFGMVVREAHRRQGLGTGLVSAVLAAARHPPGLQLIQLTVSEGNLAAHALYRKLGFTDFGTEPLAVAVPGGYVSKIHMWRPLAD